MFELMHKCDLNVSTVELKYKTMGFKKKKSSANNPNAAQINSS